MYKSTNNCQGKSARIGPRFKTSKYGVEIQTLKYELEIQIRCTNIPRQVPANNCWEKTARKGPRSPRRRNLWPGKMENETDNFQGMHDLSHSQF